MKTPTRLFAAKACRQFRVRRKERGFTLVEILIVVIILGILAAVVIPSFTSASNDARQSSVVSQLQTLRSQIQLYQLQHGDTLPDLTSGWDPLTATTTFQSTNFGPYMQTTPQNAINLRANVVDGDGGAAVSVACGFVYDYQSGSGSGRIYATDVDGKSIRPE